MEHLSLQEIRLIIMEKGRLKVMPAPINIAPSNILMFLITNKTMIFVEKDRLKVRPAPINSAPSNMLMFLITNKTMIFVEGRSTEGKTLIRCDPSIEPVHLEE
jgi:hypothetical protein